MAQTTPAATPATTPGATGVASPVATSAATSAATTAATTAATVAATSASTPASTSAATSAATAVTTPAATSAATSAATAAATAVRTGTPATPGATPRATGQAGGPGSITVIGTGRAVATPDIARVTLGVDVTADTVQDATSDANTRQAAIINQLKSLGIADKDIQTTQYNVFPQRLEPERPQPVPSTPGATPAPPRTQYRVISTVRVTIRDLKTVGNVVDAAVKAGANTVQSIAFTIDDPTAVIDLARASAVNEARRQALQLAQLNGLTLGAPIVITENIGSSPGLPRFEASDMARGAAAPAAQAPPIEAGELTYTAQIQMTFAAQP